MVKNCHILLLTLLILVTGCQTTPDSDKQAQSKSQGNNPTSTQTPKECKNLDIYKNCMDYYDDPDYCREENCYGADKTKYLTTDSPDDSDHENDSLTKSYLTSLPDDSICEKYENTSSNTTRKRVLEIIKDRELIRYKYLEKINNDKVIIGMNTCEARMAWGSPYDINTTIRKTYKREQWIYKQNQTRKYLYFENGQLTTIQDY